jgi:uncharacterized 2Fe-2S/4Fe-4S cluster protein (DUF4445 family)
MSGEVSVPNGTEEAEIGQERVAEGWRLACQTRVQGNVCVHIPPESLATAQRVQTEGQSLPVDLALAVRAANVHLPPPARADLRSDAARLRDALRLPELTIPLPVLHTLSDNLRLHDFRADVILRGSTLVNAQQANSSMLGLAMDLGTTKLAAYLVDLASGETLASAGAMNPQIAFGEDVMARIGHAMSRPHGGEQLRTTIVEVLNDLVHKLCAQTGHTAHSIVDAVIVGNTAMHHLFLGLPVRQLGLAPYTAAENAALDVNACDAGLELAPGANVYLMPNIAGFVGADHVAMLLGSGMLEREGVVLGMDIGTNTEISLRVSGKHYACSTASGPAFEGAHIRHGMRAAPGAIEKVLLHNGQILLQTVGDEPPVGLCGSGILDLVAQMLKTGIITSRGSFDVSRVDPRIRRGEHGAEFVLLPASDNKGTEITFNRSDVSEVQLAKGAMRAGVDILLQHAGVDEKDIDAVVLAGAFGTYLDVQSGIDIGMFPHLPLDRFVQVGNAAGVGACMALLSTEKRCQAAELAQQVTYVELTTEPSFSSVFTRRLLFDERAT